MSVTENHPLRHVAQPGILSIASFTTNSAYSVLRLADLPNLMTALSALAASSNSADVWRVNMANFSAFSWVCSFVSFAPSSAPISSQKSQALVVCVVLAPVVRYFTQSCPKSRRGWAVLGRVYVGSPHTSALSSALRPEGSCVSTPLLSRATKSGAQAP